MKVLQEHQSIRLVFDPKAKISAQHRVEQRIDSRWVLVFSHKNHTAALLGFNRCAGLADDYFEPGRWRMLYRGSTLEAVA